MNKNIKQELINVKNNYFLTSEYDCMMFENTITVVGLNLNADRLIDRFVHVQPITSYIPLPPEATIPPTEPVVPFVNNFIVPTDVINALKAKVTSGKITGYTIQDINNVLVNHINNIPLLTLMNNDLINMLSAQTGNIEIVSHYSENGNMYITTTASYLTLETRCTLDDDLLLYNKIIPMINYMDTPTSSQFIKYRMPTVNHYFILFNSLMEELLNFIENYKNKNTLHNKIASINTYMNIVIKDQTNNTISMDQYLNDTQTAINNINGILSKNESYFVRLKTMMADVKIADQHTVNEPYIAYYNNRENTSKIIIDDLYDTFVSSGRFGYSDKVQEYLFNIKI